MANKGYTNFSYYAWARQPFAPAAIQAGPATVSSCVNSSECGSGFVCSDGYCIDQSGYQNNGDDACGNPVDGNLAGGSCINSDCFKQDPNGPGITICEAGDDGVVVCRVSDKCEGDSHCGEGYFCADGKCYSDTCSEFNVYEKCLTDYICEHGRCWPSEDCYNDPDCAIVCPIGTEEKGGRCKGSCSTFCDNYMKTHGSLGPGCNEEQDCGACNECDADYNICRELSQDTPCWCIHPKDAPYCFDCAQDGALEQNCKDCNTCAEIPEYTCACGQKLKDPVEVCRSACDAPTRVSVEDAEEEAIRQCAELCGTEAACYGFCSEVTYEIEAGENAPACPKGYVCDNPNRSGVGGGLTIDFDSYSKTPATPNYGVIGTIQISAERLDNGTREVIDWAEQRRYVVPNSKSWKGAAKYIQIYPENDKDSSSSYLTYSRGDQVVDFNCINQNIQTDSGWGENCVSFGSGTGRCYPPDYEDAVRLGCGAGTSKSWLRIVVDGWPEGAYDYIDSDTYQRTNSSGFPVGDRYWRPACYVPTEIYNVQTLEISHNLAPGYEDDYETLSTTFDLTGSKAVGRLTRRECLREGLPPECTTADLNGDKTLAISIIDEDSSNPSRQVDWDRFTEAHSGRRMLVLIPSNIGIHSFGQDMVGDSASPVAFPQRFDEEAPMGGPLGNAYIVRREDDGAIPADDASWMSLLEREVIDFQKIKTINYWVDNSGSMTTATVARRLAEFVIDAYEKDLGVYNLTNCDGKGFGEAYIAPHYNCPPPPNLEYCMDPGSRIRVQVKDKESSKPGSAASIYITLLDFTEPSSIQYKTHTCAGPSSGKTYSQVIVTARHWDENAEDFEPAEREVATGIISSGTYGQPSFNNMKQDDKGKWKGIDLLEDGACENVETAIIEQQFFAPLTCKNEKVSSKDVSTRFEDLVMYGSNEGSYPVTPSLQFKNLVSWADVRRGANGYNITFYWDKQVLKSWFIPFADYTKTRAEYGYPIHNRGDSGLYAWIDKIVGAGNTLANLGVVLPRDKKLQYGKAQDPDKLYVVSAYIPVRDAFGIINTPGFNPSKIYKCMQWLGPNYDDFDYAGRLKDGLGKKGIPAGEHYFDWYDEEINGPLGKHQEDMPNYGDASATPYPPSENFFWMNQRVGHELWQYNQSKTSFFYGAQGRYTLVYGTIGYDGKVIDSPDIDVLPCVSGDDLGNVSWAGEACPGENRSGGCNLQGVIRTSGCSRQVSFGPPYGFG